MKFAIATVLFSMEGKPIQCRMRMWCMNAHRLNRDVFRGNASVVLVARKPNDCAGLGAVHVPHNARLRAYALNFSLTHKTNGKMSLNARFHRNLFIKWQLFSLNAYDRVVFLDSDIDPYFDIKYTPQDFLKAYHHVKDMSKRTMYALSDHASPVNAGILVITPNVSLFNIGMSIVRENKFNTTHGFELAGAPRDTISNVHGIERTACIKRNTWEFVGSDSDQGFLSYMVHSRRELKVEAPRFMKGSHFWGWAKPFGTPSCVSYHAHVKDTLGPNDSCFLSMRTNKKNNCFFNHRTHIL